MTIIRKLPYKHVASDNTEVEFRLGDNLTNKGTVDLAWEVTVGTFRVAIGSAGGNTDPDYASASNSKGFGKLRSGISFYAKANAGNDTIIFMR